MVTGSIRSACWRRGWGGQFIFVVRDLDLVVVVTSDWWDPAAIDAAYAEAFSFLDDVVVPAATP